jgi:hypothetical protein
VDTGSLRVVLVVVITLRVNNLPLPLCEHGAIVVVDAILPAGIEYHFILLLTLIDLAIYADYVHIRASLTHSVILSIYRDDTETTTSQRNISL